MEKRYVSGPHDRSRRISGAVVRDAAGIERKLFVSDQKNGRRLGKRRCRRLRMDRAMLRQNKTVNQTLGNFVLITKLVFFLFFFFFCSNLNVQKSVAIMLSSNSRVRNVADSVSHY